MTTEPTEVLIVNTDDEAMAEGCSAGRFLASDIPGWQTECAMDPVELLLVGEFPDPGQATYFALCEHHWGQFSEHAANVLQRAAVIPLDGPGAN
jgi:hypothetical protein